MTAAPTRRTVEAGDVRLLGPAVLAWAVAAVTLGFGWGARLVVVGVALAACLTLHAWVRAVRRPSGRAATWRWPVTLAVVLVALLQVSAVAATVVRERGGVRELAAGRAVVTADVLVTGEAVRVAARDGSARFVRAGTVQRLTGRGRTATTSAPVLLVGGEVLLGPRWHETVRVRGRLGPMDPADDRVATLAVSGRPVSLAPPGVVARGAERLRAGLRRAVDGAPADARGLLPGLVIGDTSRTPPDLTEAMRATGMTHLTAVSGSNVAVVTGLVLGLCAVVGVPRRLRPVLAGLALAGFVVLARPEPSVVRAAAMGAIGLLGLSRSRRSAGLPVLGGAVVLVLVLDPWLARSYGFVLSTLATLGLLLFTRPWGEAVGRRLPRRVAPLGPALAVPVAAQVMTAPVVVLLQGSVSVVGVLANLLAAPLVPPATVAGVAASLVSLLWARGAELVAWVGVVPTTGIARIARTTAEVPGGTLPWPDGPPGALLLAGLLLVVVLTGRALVAGAARRPVAVLGVALLALAALLPTRIVTWPPDGWRVVVCDVGQGDAVVLRSGPGRGVLVDVGPDPALVDGCLDRLDVTTLDAVVLTHFHADHVDGLAGALRGRTVRQVLVGPVAEPASAAALVRRTAAGAGIPVGVLHAGDRVRLGEVDAVVWSPWRRIAEGSVPNNASVVLAARTGDVDALLLGDVEREAAHDLLLRLRRDPAMAAAARGFELVKTPHHGSANLDEGLMAAVRAPVAVVSVGADNDYGHPTPAHLALLRRLGSAVYRTDQRGDVALVERRDGLRVVTAR
ncbi:ComEC/Rec2 family competence protein [Phycicoccus sp. MAQZ13P-2]|uniref:ComEC/Rec2 family competence protein n=1 Tax=Phycicoccus mangrovi TaxID=2840470 RepID=UPI001C008C25|nr:ComEC/Rec2 family competence protein [Phycicoccus mangrovi]MBT9257902.1 ComEC/Rec2 family competence protein [Phycicoccus mangrovi]MBT9272905.1 ComEC/Rec2 family competence protein [Phycicoccus mangrovi]